MKGKKSVVNISLEVCGIGQVIKICNFVILGLFRGSFFLLHFTVELTGFTANRDVVAGSWGLNVWGSLDNWFPEIASVIDEPIVCFFLIWYSW